MSNIQTFLDKIKSARYGKDVRQSIHDAIVEIDKVADTAQNSATQSAKNATASAEAAAQSETNALASADASSDSAEEAKASETNALAYKNAASTSAQDAEASNQSAKGYAEDSADSASKSAQSEANALSYSQSAKSYAEQINARIDEAAASAQSAKDSANTASQKAAEAVNASETAIEKAAEAEESASNASDFSIVATDKAAEAAALAEDANESANLATQKAESASTSEGNAKNYASTATAKANEASASATTATTKAAEASSSATKAATSESKAKASEEAAAEYEEGAEYYYEQAKSISEGFAGSLKPKGTVTFANLPDLADVVEGDMYNVSDQFTTTTSFKEGNGVVVPAGSNVYKTVDGYWDVLAGSPVTGVKGNAENIYRKGNVNITPENIGLGNVINEKQYCASNPQPSVTGSSGSCTGNSATATKATTADNVSGSEGTADSDRHVWFSHSSTETKRAYDDDFKYNPVDNELKVGKISGSAATLTNARAIDGVSFNGSAAISHYGTCSTAAATAAKTMALTGFTLVTGARVMVKFTVTNTASNPTLNVNSTGAKAIMYRGSAITAGYLAANRVYEFVYDGMDWELVGDINTDNNTKNTAGSTNSSSKLFLIGATSQAANPQTYSHDTAYVGEDGCLYSGGVKTQTITGDTKDNTAAFTSGDAASPTAWTDVETIATGEKHSSLFNKLSTMVKNVRYLYKLLGTTDISAIGDGTCTGAINAINSNLAKNITDTSNIKSKLVDTSEWITNGLDLLNITSASWAYSSNPNVKAAQGFPSGYSEYGTYFGFNTVVYKIICYIDVFGAMAIYSTNKKEWKPLGSSYLVEQRQGSFSNLAMYAGTTIQIETGKTNYTPIGIVGYKTDATAVAVHGVMLDGTVASISVANWSNIAQGGNVYVKVLYKADRA